MIRGKPEKGLTAWRPFGEVEELGRRLEDVFGWPFLPAAWRRLPAEEAGWWPALDVAEKDDKYVVKVELPGVKKDDVEVSVAGDVLTVSGEKHGESEVTKKGYHYTESSCGSFSRSIALPATVDAGKIDANFDKGILEITLPKSAEVKQKKIPVGGKP